MNADLQRVHVWYAHTDSTSFFYFLGKSLEPNQTIIMPGPAGLIVLRVVGMGDGRETGPFIQAEFMYRFSTTFLGASLAAQGGRLN